MTDNLLALEARDQWLYVAHHWPQLQNALGGRGGQALTGMPAATSPDPVAVIDLHVSDLLHEITSVTRYYARILEGETTWTPTSSHMPALLVEVAGRYGHFVADPDLTLGFTDDAHTLSERVRKTLNPTARPTYIGPCQVQNCEGELRLREDQEHARCPACGTTTTIAEQRMWLRGEMEDRLMTPTELIQAINTLGLPVSESTVWRWMRDKKLTKDEDTDLYRLAEAIRLANDKASHRTQRIVA